eukprot:CAMPEP_0181515300 /NCGR_PEP_ID=MMETSP1110-20121109/63495_1 /TAXON_ID=174948 /ORGANISM="Symbiodinium sp., Strain CCMP421" /LENGTH=32 /DNA_ID= /DNA_START= /DNA_END= /DNA_ORIENTATION=
MDRNPANCRRHQGAMDQVVPQQRQPVIPRNPV